MTSSAPFQPYPFCEFWGFQLGKLIILKSFSFNLLHTKIFPYSFISHLLIFSNLNSKLFLLWISGQLSSGWLGPAEIPGAEQGRWFWRMGDSCKERQTATGFSVQTKSWDWGQHLSLSGCEILQSNFPFHCQEGVASSPITTVTPDLGGVGWNGQGNRVFQERLRMKWLKAFSST